MSKAPRTLAALSSLLLVPLILSPSSAHNGNACGLSGWTLEGECFTSPESGCDPDFDNEHTLIKSKLDASDGQVGFVPNMSCGLPYGGVSFSESLRPNTFTVRITGQNGVHTVTFTLWVDGVEHSSRTFSTPEEVLQTFTFGSVAGSISPGTHTLRATYSADPNYLNMELDRVDFTAGSDPNDSSGGKVLPIVKHHG